VHTSHGAANGKKGGVEGDDGVHGVKQRAENRECVIIERRDAVVWRWVMIDNEAGGRGGRGWDPDYIEDGVASQLQSVASRKGDSWS
jgi:hypothetical protein